MTQLKINTGLTPNDKSADSLFSAFNKVNANFTELYKLVSSPVADNLTGTIPAEVLANSTVYIGTTPLTLNRESGNLVLSGVDINGYASALKSETTTVSVANSQAPTAGQVLTAVSDTTAIWKTQRVISSADNPPPNPIENELWFDSVSGRLYVYYSNAWIDTNPESDITGSTIMSATPPISANPGDFWFDSTGGRLYIRYSNAWVETNPN